MKDDEIIPEVNLIQTEASNDIQRDAVQPSKPKSKKKWLWTGLIAVLIAAGLGYWFFVREDEPQASISSYEECVAAGYPVMESYPEQCAVPGGQTFTRQLSEEEQDNLNNFQDSTSYTSKKGTELIITSPLEGERISDPLIIEGQVPGTWSFEGVFPIKLLDSLGNTLAETQGVIEGDWMSDDLLPFGAELEFNAESGAGATLVLIKDNPSGLSENDDSLSLALIVE